MTVRYPTVSGTAAAWADFTAADGTLTFRPGETKKAVRVAVTAGARERDLDFFLTLASATNAVIADGVGLGTIRAKADGRPSPTSPRS